MSISVPRRAVPGEKIPGAGRAQLDMIATVYRYRLTERVATTPEKGTHPWPGASATDRPGPLDAPARRRAARQREEI